MRKFLIAQVRPSHCFISQINPLVGTFLFVNQLIFDFHPLIHIHFFLAKNTLPRLAIPSRIIPSHFTDLIAVSVKVGHGIFPTDFSVLKRIIYLVVYNTTLFRLIFFRKMFRRIGVGRRQTERINACLIAVPTSTHQLNIIKVADFRIHVQFSLDFNRSDFRSLSGRNRNQRRRRFLKVKRFSESRPPRQISFGSVLAQSFVDFRGVAGIPFVKSNNNRS